MILTISRMRAGGAVDESVARARGLKSKVYIKLC